MKHKYIDEHFEAHSFHGDLFYRFNSRFEECIDVSSLPKESVERIVINHNAVLNELKSVIERLEKYERYELPDSQEGSEGEGKEL